MHENQNRLPYKHFTGNFKAWLNQHMQTLNMHRMLGSSDQTKLQAWLAPWEKSGYD